MATRYDTVVIGGGAAGIVAAISAKRRHANCLLVEKKDRLGRKVLASGNGRCNLMNEELSESFYNRSSRGLVKSVFSRFGKAAILSFFQELGLKTYSEGSRIFPATNQSGSLLKCLELELKRLSVPVELNFDVSGIACSPGGFRVTPKKGAAVDCGQVIIASGGKSYPAFGSDGSLFDAVKKLGHSIIEPVPSVVPLVVKDPLCHLLQGQKINASARSVIKSALGSFVKGDLLFTKYGLSGTAILDISEEVSIAMNRERVKDVAVSVDMVPFMDNEQLESEISSRIAKGWAREDLISGILPNKFQAALKDLLNKDAKNIAGALKDRRFNVTGTRGWNEAEFTAGGVDSSEIKESTLESKIKKGLYLAGEICDVDGRRGGYNLAWAWASGYIAGMTE
ncbi:MAG: aminoacetone oxidase family FAD-binding enzyme [Candidatus Omnitrophota bacterium]|jgi:hypothetical protein